MKGQTLIEILIALSVASIIVFVITAAVLNGLSNSQFAERKNTATHYAQEGLELMQEYRISSRTEFASYNGAYCLDEGATAAGLILMGSGCIANVETYFERIVTITRSDTGYCRYNNIPSANDSTQVRVDVKWYDSKCKPVGGDPAPRCHSASISTCISNYDVVPTP